MARAEQVDNGQIDGDQLKAVLRWTDPARAAGQPVEDSVPLIVAFMRRDDVDGIPGLSRADAVLRARMDMAGSQMEQLQQLLANDLDGNLEIHRSEAETRAHAAASKPLRTEGGLILPDPEQRAAVARRIADKVMAADTDGDGVVSEAEIRALAQPRPDSEEAFEKRLSRMPAMQIVGWADADGDGTASPDEIAAWVRRVLDPIDTDKDGRLSRAELEVVK